MKKTLYYSTFTSFKRFLLLTTIVTAGMGSALLLFWFQRDIPPISVKTLAQTSTVNRSIRFGTADPDKVLLNFEPSTIDHIFVPWGPIHLESTKNKISLLNRNRELLLTIEPFKTQKNENLLENIFNGSYDAPIQNICQAVTDSKKKTMIRFAHEMDTNNSKYPWSNLDPKDYINIYIRFVNLCKQNAPEVVFMWSPNGERNAMQYYPGDKYVDVVGLSAYGYPEFEQKTYGKILTFDEMFTKKYDTIKSINKPIIIAEFGVTGDLDYKIEYIKTAYKSLKTNPRYDRVVILIYFYYFNPTPWIPGIEKPDYRLDPIYLSEL